MTDDAQALLSAFRKVKRMSNDQAVDINLVMQVANLPKITAHMALHELVEGGYVAPTHTSRPTMLGQRT